MGKYVSEIISKEICDKYKSGLNISECAKIFNYNPQTISNHLKKHNINVTNFKLDKNLNINYFNVIDSEYKAYILGFILADGNISKTTNRVCITLNEKDIEILEFIKKELHSNNSIRKYDVYDKRTNKINKQIVFQFSSKKIKESLSNIGINYNKTLSFVKPYNIPDQFINHFLRGLFDGDGYIDFNRVRISIISTKEFLGYINEYYLNKTASITDVSSKKNVYRLTIDEGATCCDFLNYIYKDATFCLERKKVRYLNLLDKVNNQKLKCIKKEVFLIKDGEKIKRFDSLLECAKQFKISPSHLSKMIKQNKLINGLLFVLGESSFKETPYKGKSNFINK
jgi:hypothetical protein